MAEYKTDVYWNRYRKAMQLTDWRRYEEALKEALNLIRDYPEDPDVYALAGYIHLKKEKYDEATHWSGEALGRDPENRLGWFVRVSVLCETEKGPKLDEALREARRISPYDSHYLFLQANLDNQKGRFEKAKASIEGALALEPENALYIAMLSYIEALLKRDEESRRLEKEALRIDPNSSHVFTYLAWAAGRRGEYAVQAEMLKNAIRLDPDNAQIRSEYLDALQQTYKVYRFFLAPVLFMRRWKPWQMFLAWAIAWMLFKPLVLLFILLYVVSHWATKLLVHVKVFGWTFRRT